VIPGLGGLLAAYAVIAAWQLFLDPSKQIHAWQSAWEKQAVEDDKGIRNLTDDVRQLTSQLADVDATVQLLFDDSDEYLIDPRRREGYPNSAKWAVRFSVTASRTLKSTGVFVSAVCKWSDGSYGPPINQRVPAWLPWYSWTPPGAYSIKDISGINYVDLFVADKRGRHVAIVTNGKEPEIRPLENLSEGRYLVEVMIKSETLRTGEYKRTFIVDIGKDMATFSMNLEPKEFSRGTHPEAILCLP
jgi:hypothetical protein